MSLRQLELDASGWITAVDFYDALLALLKAPDWHGRNVNALVDSVIHGDINEVEPPYEIVVRNLSNSSVEARDELYRAFGFLAEDGALLTASRYCVILKVTDDRS